MFLCLNLNRKNTDYVEAVVAYSCAFCSDFTNKSTISDKFYVLSSELRFLKRACKLLPQALSLRCI